jgi:hypothetical protein
LLSGELIVALDDIALPKILAHLRGVGIESNRLEIVSNPFVGVSQLAGRITAIVERARSVRIVQKIEDTDRFLIAVGLGERIGVFSEIRVWQHAAVSHETLTMLGVPDHSRRAGCEVRPVHLVSAAASPAIASHSARRIGG